MYKVIKLRSFTRGFSSFEHFWMPFTHNRAFKNDPKLFTAAKNQFYYLEDGSEILDGISGLWCSNLGHSHPIIVDAVKKQLDRLDYASCFNIGHDLPFLLADEILSTLPRRHFSQVFFTMCGSTAVDTALKIALAYHKSKGDSGRVRFIGRERGYHGVGFGGISVGGITANRKQYSSSLLPFIDHLPHTHSLKDMAFSKGMPSWGSHLAEELEKLIILHDPSTIAGVIIEPVVGSAGVIPPPVGYLERIREICTKHNVLLIFDEVITGFGRVGASFAAERFGVIPDLITCAKGLTNGVIPAGAVITRGDIYDAILASSDREGQSSHIELFHGYTYSGHPVAMAAGLATLKVFKEQNIYDHVLDLAPYWEEGLHSLKGLPHVVDIRNFGMMGAVELAPIAGHPVRRTTDVFERCFRNGLFVRYAGNNICGALPLIVEKTDIDRFVNTLGDAILESSKSI